MGKFREMKIDCSLILLTGILLKSSAACSPTPTTTQAPKPTTITPTPTPAPTTSSKTTAAATSTTPTIDSSSSSSTKASTTISSSTSSKPTTAITSTSTKPTSAPSPSTSSMASTSIFPSTSVKATTTTTAPEPSTMSTTSTTKIPCPEGWMDASYMDLGCIFFANRGFSWADADNYCQENSSALLEVHSETLMDFIRSELFVLENFVGDHVWWTGGSDVGREGQWYWTHTLKDIGEFVWKEDYPMGGIERQYLALSNDYDYFGADFKNDFHTGYPICQKL